MNVDYLAITTKDTTGEPFDDALRVKGYLGGEWVGSHGRNGYKRSFRHDSGAVILFDGTADMGLHLVLPATALAFFAENLELLFEDFQWKASRIDIAADTQDVSVKEVVENPDWVVTRAQGRVLVHDLVSGGMTLYIGSPGKSRKLVRVYDKGVERQSHPPGQLTRIEVQLRDEYAAAAFESLRTGVRLADIMLRSVDFREPVGSRKCARQRLAWWEAIVGSGDSGFRFPSLSRAVESIERIQRWIEHQVAASLVKCDMALGRSWLHGLLFRGAARVEASFYTRLGGVCPSYG